MEFSEAKRLIAAYLSGTPLDPLIVEEACRAAANNQRYAKDLFEELGAAIEWDSACRSLRSHLAELAHLTQEVQQDEMPELAAHLEVCMACRHLYWDLRPLWTTAESGAETHTRKDSFTPLVRILATRLRFAVGRAGRVLDAARGPLSRRPELIAATMSAAPTESAENHREWVLPDTVVGTAVRLQVNGKPSGAVQIRLDVDSQTGSPIASASLHNEIWDVERGALVLAADISNLKDPIYLRPGAWLIKLEADAGGRRVRWELPIEISPADEQGAK